MTSVEPSETRSAFLRRRLGFPLSATPVVMILGLGVLLGTTPELFDRQLLRIPVHTSIVLKLRQQAYQWLQNWQTLLDSDQVQRIDRILVPASFIAVLSLVTCSLYRSLRARRLEPTVLTVLAFGGGLLALPATTWIAEICIVVWRVAKSVTHAVASIFRDIAPGLAIIVGLVALIGAGMAILSASTRQRYIALGGAVALALVVAVGEKTTFFRPVAGAFIRLGRLFQKYVGKYMLDALRWLIVVVSIAVLTCVVIGLLVAVLGQLGRTVLLPVLSAPRAGTDRGTCVDLAAGVGVTTSVVLCGAALDNGSDAFVSTTGAPFHQQFAAEWAQAPLLHWLPNPTSGFAALLPAAAKHVLAPAFVAYNPLIDSGLLLLVSSLGVLSMLLAPSRWGRDVDQRIFIPIMVAIGIAVAAVLPLIITWLLLRAKYD